MKNVTIEKQYLVAYGDIFAGKIEPSELLKDLPQLAALELITYLLHLFNVRKKNDLRFQSHHLFQWVMQLPEGDKMRMFRFIQNNNVLINDPGFKVIDRRPCLDLIQHILFYSAPGTDAPLNKAHISTLLKCLLHFNGVENKAQENLFNWDGKGSVEQFTDYILTVQFRNIEQERPKNYQLQFLKVYYFFQFCESHKTYAGYLETFLKKLCLAGYRGYLFKLIDPYLRLMTNDEPTPKICMSGDGAFLGFYDRLAINGKITGIDQDYKPLRQYPLFKTEENCFVFMDFRFFVDKLYQGFLFDFATIAELPYGTLKGDMGNEFSEHVLFYTVMRKCFGNYGDVRLRGEAIKAKISSGEPDYYIRSGNVLFLFEFKDRGMAASVKYTGDAGKIKEGISAIFERSAKGKNSGITQLLNTIAEIIKGKYREKDIDRAAPEQLIIYPLIVHTDITFESAGVNYFLGKRMKALTTDCGMEKIEIKQVVLIDIDTLMLLQDHFNTGKLDLRECIESYISYTSSEDPQTATFPFDEYIKYYFVEKNHEKIHYPKEFDEIIESFVKTNNS